MKSFRYTILTVNLIRRHARGGLSASSIARLMECQVSTIEMICRKHEIEFACQPEAASLVPEPAVGAPPVHPMLDPVRRRARNNLTGMRLEIGGGALTVIEREAARRGTTASILVARMAELIAQDNIFAAVLDS